MRIFGIIIEFKRIKDTAPKTIDEGVNEALKQIEENRYEAELEDRNVLNIWKLAIVFKGKRVKIVNWNLYIKRYFWIGDDFNASAK